MKSRAPSFAIALSLLSGCALPTTEESAGPVETNARVVVVAIDDATVAWAQETASVTDGQPIGPPGDPAKRFREVHARLVDRLGTAPARPAVVSFDYMFPPNDGASTALLAAALGRAPMPIVLARLDDGPVSPIVHATGASRFEGHASVLQELVVTPDGDRVAISLGAWGMPLEGREGDALAVPESLSMATFAAHALVGGATREAALARVHDVAASLAVETTVGYQTLTATAERITVVPIAEKQIEVVSAADVLRDDAARDALAGAIVIVGETTSTSVDRHDLRRDGTMLPGVLAQGWLVRTLLDAATPPPPCAASETGVTSDCAPAGY